MQFPLSNCWCVQGKIFLSVILVTFPIDFPPASCGAPARCLRCWSLPALLGRLQFIYLFIASSVGCHNFILLFPRRDYFCIPSLAYQLTICQSCQNRKTQRNLVGAGRFCIAGNYSLTKPDNGKEDLFLVQDLELIHSPVSKDFSVAYF